MNFCAPIKILLWHTCIVVCSLSDLLAVEESGTIVGQLAFPKTVKGRHLAVEKYTGSISGKVTSPPPRVAGVWLTREGLTAAAIPTA